MARPATIQNDELLLRLTGVFRDVGYAGASLAVLSEATGLKKASLYHRFPDGKEQMALEVLEAAENWVAQHILTPLKGDGTPEERIDAMVRELRMFYSGGKQACLLNMLSSAHIHNGPFTKQIKRMFAAWISALTVVLQDAGFEQAAARQRARRAVALIQGSLVLSRGMGTTGPFRECLSDMNEELLG